MTAIFSDKPAADIEGLIDIAADAAASCIRHGIILQAIDWRNVDGQKVQHILEHLYQDNTPLPPWLAKALLIGGHILPPEYIQKLGLPLRLLHGINSIGTDNHVLAFVEQTLADIEFDSNVDPEVAVAIVKGLLSKGLGSLAIETALKYWRHVPQTVGVVKENLAAQISALPEVKIRVLGFSTTNILAQDLLPAFARFEFQAKITEGSFGEVIHDLLIPKGLDADALIIMMDLAGFYNPDWRAPSEKAFGHLQEKLETFSSALETFSEKEGLPILINTLPASAAPSVGFIDGRHQNGESRTIDIINQRLNSLARNNSNMILVDGNMALAAIAPVQRTDPKLWYYGRLPYSSNATRSLANGFAQAWDCLKNGKTKVIALDLDNTLWGGIYGEDGTEGLKCNDDFPGNAFKAFQQECLRLKAQGLLLTILSKNNPDAINIFKKHPGMVLKEEDFVATRINWETKPINMCSIADEISLGLNSFLFIDDSPHEREAMRRLCPEVRVPEMPDDPARRPQWLRELSSTWPIRLTDEDSRRSDMYMAEQKATALRATALSFDDYLSGLEQQLVVSHVTSETVSRVAQMHIRTNQFNLTTQRYDESDIKAMISDEQQISILFGRVEDKFGDHGIVICAVVDQNEDKAALRSFLMSCRVIGREIEKAFLGEVLSFLKERGIQTVEGAYIPTEKNKIVREFYQQNGFTSQTSDGEKSLWRWNASEGVIPKSDFVDVSWNRQEMAGKRI